MKRYYVSYMDMGQGLTRSFETRERAQEFLDVNAMICSLRDPNGGPAYITEIDLFPASESTI